MIQRIITLLALPIVLLVAVSNAQAQETPIQIDCPICSIDLSGYSGPLSQDEIHGLLLALNDEYHAWAVYDQVVRDFGPIRPFVNIRSAEQMHIAHLRLVFDAYQVPVPDNPWPGNVPRFATIRDACLAGVEAEIANRALYDYLFTTTEREEILFIYRALQWASEYQHLPAFLRCAR